MLLTNQRLDKLAATRSDFVDRGMLPENRHIPPLLDPRAQHAVVDQAQLPDPRQAAHQLAVDINIADAHAEDGVHETEVFLPRHAGKLLSLPLDVVTDEVHSFGVRSNNCGRCSS